jgi:hypothetical protein
MTSPDKDENQNDDLGISEDEAKQLLDDPGEQQSTDRDDDPLKAEIAKWKSLARKHEGEAKKLGGKLSEYENANKTDRERLEERAGTAETRAGTAEAKAKALEIALERAPAHATLAQVKAVAKRVRGDDDDSLERDADELFELLAPAQDTEPKPGTKTPARPKERLKGGSADPDEDPEENDPRKLAALLPRRR